MYVSMKEMLLHAHKNNYAVMAINCVNMEQAKAIIESAEEEKSAVIINISPRQMKAHGHGEIMAPMIRGMAERVSVPVAFNLDHGAAFEDIVNAMKYGFSSVNDRFVQFSVRRECKEDTADRVPCTQYGAFL